MSFKGKCYFGISVLFILSLSLVFPKLSLAATVTTLYLPSYEKVVETGERNTYYAVPGITIQRVQKDGVEKLYNLFPDHLGSTRVVANNDYSGFSYLSYYPYGKTKIDTNPNSSVQNLYTGQKQDQEIDLYYYNARYYNQNTAHFISADKAEGPNRYAYVGNNPIMRNDPSGMRVDSGNINFSVEALITRSATVVIYDGQPSKITNNPVYLSYRLREKLLTTLGVEYNLSFIHMGKLPDPISREEIQKDPFFINFRSWINDNYASNENNNFDYKKLYNDLNMSVNKTDEVWIWTWGTDKSTTFESAYMGDEKIPVMGLNYKGWGVDAALHSYGHRIEYELYQNPNSLVRDKFGKITGNMEYYTSSPYQYMEGVRGSCPSFQGIGNIHFPPNGVHAYDYDGPLMVNLQGFSIHDCSLWGCNQIGYMDWWYKQFGVHKEIIPEIFSAK